MKKKTIAIVSFILFFAVVGVVAFMLLNKKDNTKDTKTTTTTTVEATTTTTTTKKEEKKTNKKTTTKKVAYTCPEGYKLDGTKCYKQYDATAKCSSGSYDVDGTCVNIAVANKKAADVVCQKGEKTFVGYYFCKGNRISVDSQDSCKNAGGQWIADAGECYEKETVSYTCSKGYKYISNPNTYVSSIHGESGCYPISNKTYSCSNSDDKLDGTKCIKTVNAKVA